MEGVRDRFDRTVRKNMKESHHMLSRRRLLISATGLTLLSPRSIAAETLFSGSQKTRGLPDQLTEEEIRATADSAMAQELTGFFGQGYSCAESLFLVALRKLGRPEDLVWAMAGFGGGMYHQDLCGFLTGGIASLGVAAGLRHNGTSTERAETKEKCATRVKAYWDWWTSMAPLHCREIRTPGSGSGVCRRLGLLAAAQIESIIAE